MEGLDHALREPYVVRQSNGAVQVQRRPAMSCSTLGIYASMAETFLGIAFAVVALVAHPRGFEYQEPELAQLDPRSAIF